MTGISPGFVNAYKDVISQAQGNKDNITQPQIDKLINLVKSGSNDSNAIAELKKLISTDKSLSGVEDKILKAIGTVLDKKDLESLIKDASSISSTTKGGVSTHDSSPVTVAFIDSLKRGNEQSSTAGERYKEDHSIKSKLRDMSDGINTSLKAGIATAKAINPMAKLVAWAIPVETKKAIMEQLKVETNETAGKTVLKEDIVAGKEYMNESMGKDDCVEETVRYMAKKAGVPIDPKKFGAVDINEKFLSSLNKNLKWDGINVAQQNKNGKLDQLLAGQERKAFVVVGDHTYVFDKIEGNKLKVVDPANNNRVVHINKDNLGAAVFVMGKGDGNETTGDINKKEAVAKFSFDKNPNESDKIGDSANVRKFMANLTNKDVLDGVEKFAKNPTEGALNEFQAVLKAKGINIDSDELRALSTKIAKPSNGTSVLNELKKLANSPDSNAKTNFDFGIRYSDIPLNSYFVKTDPSQMIKAIQEMKEGRDGC